MQSNTGSSTELDHKGTGGDLSASFVIKMDFWLLPLQIYRLQTVVSFTGNSPIRGLFEVMGMMEETVLRNIVSDSSMVTPRIIQLLYSDSLLE